MATERTVQAFNDLKEIYLNSVAPEFITEAKKPLTSKQRKYLDKAEPYGKLTKADFEELHKENNLSKIFIDKSTRNSEESVKNVERHRRALAGQRCESYSNWREESPELLEALEGDDSKTIDVSNKVDNYKQGYKKKPVVEINPSMHEAFEGYDVEVIDSQELDESYIQEAIEVAAEYFYESGLNEFGVEEVIELLGENKFSDFVFDLVEDYELNEESLLEWRRGPGGSKIRGSQVDKKGRPIKDLPVRGGVKTKAIKATPEHQARAAEKGAEDNPSERERHFKELSARQKALRSASANKAIETAKEKPQNAVKSSSPTTKQLIGRIIARSIGSGVKATADLAGRGILSAGKGVEAAKKTKGSALQKAGAGIAAAVKAHHKKGTAHFEEYNQLQEKSESQAQQQLFGIALSVKRGEAPRSKVSKAVLDIVDSMSEAEIRKFAKTKHKGLPQHVKEELLVSKVLRIIREDRNA